MVIWVREKELEQFLPMIPEDMQESVISGEYLCLGGLWSDEEEENTKDSAGEVTAAGVLVFSPEEGISDDEEIMNVIEIKWIYVDEEFRQKGVANEMMQTLSEILEDNPAEGIICDVPFGSEYDLTEAFFASWGFQFELIDNPEVIITKDDCRRKIGETKKKELKMHLDNPGTVEGLTAVPDIPEELFRRELHALKEAEKTGYYDRISEDRDAYDTDLSYAILDEGEITSLILFERLSDEELHLVMIASKSQSRVKELLFLLEYAASYYFQNYPEKTVIRLTAGTERSRNLVAKVFPDKDPIPMRRGVFY